MSAAKSLTIGAFGSLFVANEIRGAISAGPVLAGMIAAGTIDAMIAGAAVLVGIAASVFVPILALKMSAQNPRKTRAKLISGKTRKTRKTAQNPLKSTRKTRETYSCAQNAQNAQSPLKSMAESAQNSLPPKGGNIYGALGRPNITPKGKGARASSRRLHNG